MERYEIANTLFFANKAGEVLTADLMDSNVKTYDMYESLCIQYREANEEGKKIINSVLETLLWRNFDELTDEVLSDYPICSEYDDQMVLLSEFRIGADAIIFRYSDKSVCPMTITKLIEGDVCNPPERIDEGDFSGEIITDDAIYWIVLNKKEV